MAVPEKYSGIRQLHKPAVAVIGAGVIGLTNAILAQESGYQVVIYSDLQTFKTTSMATGSTFAPYSVPLTEQVLDMTGQGWGKYADLAKETQRTGVRQIFYWEIDSNPVDPKDKPYLQVMKDVQLHERPFVPGGYLHGIRYQTFIMDMPIFLPFLVQKFMQDGGLFFRRRFTNLEELALLEADVVFNCTGLGAKELTGDKNMTAIKGQLAIVPYRHDLADAIKHDGFYAFPQPQTNRTVLGGTTVETFDTLADPGTTQTIINANKRILPGLSEKDLIESLVGLRPFRKGDVRVEAQNIDGKLIIHNYGHGGAGVTLSWGSGRLALSKR